MRIQIRIRFYLNADLNPGSQTSADPNPDPDPGQSLPSKTVVFLHGEKYTSKSWKILRYTVHRYRTKAFLKGEKSGLFVNFN